MSDNLGEDERARRHAQNNLDMIEAAVTARLRLAEKAKADTQEQIERYICWVWDVEYRTDGTHRVQIRAKREVQDEMAENYRTKKTWIGTAITAVITAAITFGAGLLSGLFGMHKP